MVLAYVLIVVKTGKEKEVQDRLSRLDEISEVHSVYGDYDLIAKIETGTLDSLNDVVISKLRNIESISLTTTLIAL